MPTTLHIRLPRRADGWPPFDSEEVAAEAMDDDTYRLIQPPAFAKRLAVGDVVRTRDFGQPPVPWVDGLVDSAGHSTVRVVAMGAERDQTVIDMLADLGLVARPTPLAGLFVVDIPAHADYKPIRSRLMRAHSAGEIDFEEAALSPTHDYQ